ncbi:hypothetical protein [Synergistes jonesii]|uniref:Uncharacterized protein n=1 Tax=Synergistes jonesii TaxID=2754 RepID=A0A073IN20_9BACT|nr:hypothetical protein [Synergistes jonesii]KEJ91114.1 hypothetical protein EH55_13120 [Synergistes jonesii]OFB60229.1 hypothetical protein JS73_12930 [Synergistes jonesii]OFB60954.1 hypothetical protein JS79_12565 [Synergistes jonesii]OFB64598.1 hypothetical protein JS72_03870 [Synergistes jonesii]OFB66436.1 hypothetical protein JS78_12950 [Synergistes jonesii]
MKRYIITEKQLDELKKLLERYEEGLPTRYCGGSAVDDLEAAQDLIDEMEESVEKDWNSLFETWRDLKFLIEDVEGQEERK